MPQYTNGPFNECWHRKCHNPHLAQLDCRFWHKFWLDKSALNWFSSYLSDRTQFLFLNYLGVMWGPPRLRPGSDAIFLIPAAPWPHCLPRYCCADDSQLYDSRETYNLCTSVLLSIRIGWPQMFYNWIQIKRKFWSTSYFQQYYPSSSFTVIRYKTISQKCRNRFQWAHQEPGPYLLPPNGKRSLWIIPTHVFIFFHVCLWLLWYRSCKSTFLLLLFCKELYNFGFLKFIIIIIFINILSNNTLIEKNKYTNMKNDNKKTARKCLFRQ